MPATRKRTDKKNPIVIIGVNDMHITCDPCHHNVVLIIRSDKTFEHSALNGVDIAKLYITNGFRVPGHFRDYLTEKYITDPEELSKLLAKERNGKAVCLHPSRVLCAKRPATYPGKWSLPGPGEPDFGKVLWEAQNSVNVWHSIPKGFKSFCCTDE